MTNARGENVASSRDRENFVTFALGDGKIKTEAFQGRESRWRPFSFGSPTDFQRSRAETAIASSALVLPGDDFSGARQKLSRLSSGTAPAWCYRRRITRIGDG